MKRNSMTKVLTFCCLAIAGWNSTGYAGVLDGHAAAYNGIAGSVAFNDGLGLSGTIDYAIFTAEDFDANFGGLGYVPSGGLVYAFQVANTGLQSITSETIGVPNPANTIGTFDIGNVDASSAAFAPDAEWTFTPGIAPGESSWGLAFSSYRLPIVGFSTVVGEETSWFFAGVPVTGNLLVPEPGSATILALGAMLLLLWRRKCG